MWVLFILAASAGLWAANRYKESQPKITVTPIAPPPQKAAPNPLTPVKLRLVRAFKSVVKYPGSSVGNMAIGPPLPPLLDASKIDEMGERARLKGDTAQAEKFRQLSKRARAAQRVGG